MYGLLAKCEVKMAGYWPSSIFACLWTEMESRFINTQKKNKAEAGSPERARWLHLACSDSQSQCRI